MRIITLGRKNIFPVLFCLVFFAGLTNLRAQCPTVTNTSQSYCDLEAPTVANLAATPNGNGVAWYATAVSTTALTSTTGLVDGEDYFADDLSGTCGTRTRVVVTIYGKPFAQSFQGPCVDQASDATIADLTATGNNIQWYIAPSGGSPLPSTTVLTDNTFYYASQTNPNTGCETSRRSVLVTVGIVPVPTGDPTQEFCNLPGNPPTLNDVVVSGNNNWYATAASAIVLPLSTPLVNGQSYFATTLDPPCESIERFEVTVTLVSPNNAGTNGTRSLCVSALPSTPPFNLFGLLGGTPDSGGAWTGPVATTNGSLGTLNVAGLTVAGSPYVFTYTASNALCAPATSTVTIIVLPLPVVSIAANATICSGSSATVTFTGTPNATVTYTINGGGNQTVVLNGSGTATVTNTYTANAVFNLVSVASAGTPSCSQPQSGTVTITVLPLPTVTISTGTTICPGSSATVTFTGTPNATVTYTVNGGGNQTIVLNAAGTATITNTYSTTTVFALVSVASASTPVCSQPQTGSMTITVRPLPTVTISGSSNVCPNGFASVIFTGTPNATVTYTMNPGGTQTIVLNASGSATITTTYTVTTTYTLVSVATAGVPSCSQPQTGSLTITVLPLPIAAISSSTTICSGSSATVTFTGTPNATVTYNINGGGSQTIVLNAAGTATLTNTYTATAVFHLTSVASAGSPSCSQAQTGVITITVTPLPTVTISANASVCPNGAATVTFTGTPNATVTYTANPGGTQTIVLNAAGTAAITANYAVTTTYTLVSVASPGTPSCVQPVTGVVTINVIPLPTVTISGTASVCPNGAATITFTGTPNATVTYNINGGGPLTIVLNAAGTATIANTYTANTTFNLVSVVTSGTPACPAPVTGSAVITVVPLPTATIASSSTICVGASATVTFTGTPNATVTYTANPGGTQTITLNAAGTAALTQTYSATTIYTLVSVASAGTPSCTQPVTGTITITVAPLPTVAISSNATICSGSSATVTFTGTPNATVTYTINGGGNQTIVLNAAGTATLTNTYTANAVFNLVSVVTTGTPGCTAPATGTITITVTPTPVVTIASSTTVCSGASATVTFIGTPNATVTYTTNPGGTQTIVLNAAGTATLTNTYTATTVFTLVSIATAGTPSCPAPVTGTITITVAPLPVATFAANATICSGASATITFTGTPNATVTYTATPGGTQTIVLSAAGTATLTQTYSATTVYNLVSVASSGTPGCSQPLTGTVTITVLPLPIVAISSNATVCSGSSATVTFTGTPNATVTYTATPGGTQTIVLNAAGTATLTNTYTTTTVYTLVSVASAGTPSCINPQTGTITISVTPLPTVTIAASTSICTGSSATVTFTGTPNATVTYNIDGGGSQTIVLNAAGAAAITNTYTATTIFNLVSIATSGTPSCSQPQTGSVTITVLPIPIAAISGNVTICANSSATVNFTGTPNATITYTANPGGTQTIVLDAAGNATLTNIYTATTVFTLVSVATPGTPSCSVPVTGTITVTVTPLPVVTIASNVTICSGSSATVTFTGTPNANVTYNIGGGSDQTIVLDASGTATITNTYLATTTFNLVSVVLTGTPTCSQPQTGSVTITVEPIPTATISGAITICSGTSATVTFTGTPNAIVSYTANGSAATVTLNASGTATVSGALTTTTIYNLVSITTAGLPGCTAPLTGTITVTVLPLPTVTMSANSNVCLGDTSTVTFTGTPNATVTYTVNTSGNQTVTLDNTGIATVTGNYTVNTTFILVSIQTNDTPSCSQPVSQVLIITVNPLPTVTISGNATVCAGSSATITFTGTPNSTVIYTINGTSHTITIGPLGTATFNQAYTVTSIVNLVSITMTNPPLCSQPVTGTITINVTQPPIAGSNAVLPLCGNSAPQDLFLLLGASAQAGGTWSPALASGTGVFNPAVDVAGTYIYTVVAAPPCVNDTASATVTVTPQTDAGNDAVANLCSNANPVDLFTLLTGTPQTGGTWSPTLPSGTGLFNPGSDSAGVYTYTVLGVAPCVDDSATVTVAITPGPDAGQDGSVAFCLNSAAQDLFLSLGGTPQVGGTWSPALASGTGLFNPAVDAAGIYTYTFSGNQPCDDDTAIVTVTVNPIPDAGTDGTAIFCTNYAPSDLFANLGGTPQPGGTWSPALASGTGVFNPLVDAAGTYTYTVGGGLCSTDTATVAVQVFQSPNAGGLGATLSINACVTSNSVDLNTGLNGSQGVGVWTANDSTGALTGNIFDPTVVGAGTYHFTYTVSGGISPCLTDTAIVTVIVSPIPNAGTFTGVQSICTSVGTFDLSTLLTGSQTTGTWTDANGTVINPINVSALAANTYSYTYTVTNACGTDTEIVQLTILPNPVLNLPNVSISSPICTGQDATVSFSGMTDGTYTLTYDLSVSNIVTGLTANLVIAGGVGTITIPAANIPNTGITTVTFLNIASAATSCAALISDVSANFIVNPIANLESADLDLLYVCLGSDATVGIFSAVDLPDGNYQFNYTINTNSSIVTGTTGIIAVAGGAGTFTIPASLLTVLGNYTLTIDSIISLSGGCSNLAENATIPFEVDPVPDLVDSDLTIANVCLGTDPTVQINTTGLPDGDYSFVFTIPTGTPTTSTVNSVTITAGVGQFSFPSSITPTAGNYTLTIDAIYSPVHICENVTETATAVFQILPASDLQNSDLSIANICLGSDATVQINNATGMPDGNYQFNFTIPTGTPTTGTTGTIAIAGGIGQFIIPASYLAAAGNYTVTINSITNLSGGCDNLTETATAVFQVAPIPNTTGATLQAATACLNFSNDVNISGAAGLPDGNYSIDYQLSGANTATTTVIVAFVNGAGTFTIPAADLANPGNTTVTVTALNSPATTCGTGGTNFTAITFDVSQLAEPTITPKGNELCGANHPTFADLSANMDPTTILWYDNANGGTAYASTDLLQDGSTYYAAAVSTAGCESATRLPVTVDLTKCEVDNILIPDGFSPNDGDNINSAFHIKNLRETYPNFKLEIYNRYGNILYKGNTNTPDWDGTTSQGGIKLGDSQLPVGVYF
jgi:mucin-2